MDINDMRSAITVLAFFIFIGIVIWALGPEELSFPTMREAINEVEKYFSIATDAADRWERGEFK